LHRIRGTQPGPGSEIGDLSEATLISSMSVSVDGFISDREAGADADFAHYEGASE
jgi:hypothetical protein